MAFTLAELLIALAILGVIATFTIPKILQAQQDSRNRAIVKEAAGILTGAYQVYQAQQMVTQDTSVLDLTPSINYLRIDTSGKTIDNAPAGGTNHASCNVNQPCLVMANGAYLMYFDTATFAGWGALAFLIDPNGTFDDKKDSLRLFMAQNGKVTSEGGWNNDPSLDPAWFSW